MQAYDASLGLCRRCAGKEGRKRVLRCSGSVCVARVLQEVGPRCVAQPVYAVHGENASKARVALLGQCLRCAVIAGCRPTMRRSACVRGARGKAAKARVALLGRCLLCAGIAGRRPAMRRSACERGAREKSAEGACCVARGRQAVGLLSVARTVFALRGKCRP
jgi:hypothetical protein